MSQILLSKWDILQLFEQLPLPVACVPSLQLPAQQQLGQALEDLHSNEGFCLNIKNPSILLYAEIQMTQNFCMKRR